MLLTQSSFFSLPSLNFSHGKNSQKPNNRVSLFSTYGNNILKSSSRSNGKVGFSYNGYTYFPSPHHPLESELPLDEESDGGCGGGIGIDDFFHGKNIFITGATGLVGKVLVEKLLRSTLVGKIYILVKAKDKEGALDRLSKEIIKSDLFESIREKYGKSYDEFVRERLIPVVGNICEPNLGMDSHSMNAIMNEVDVIIESAASTTLNDRYDVLIDLNTTAPLRLMRFAKKCKNLKLVAHISTAYVNGRREGVILEKPLVMGDHGRKEDDSFSSSSSRGVDLTDEMNLAMKSCLASTDCDATKDLRRLGMERATYFGWYNSYHMTKAMGEMVLNETRGDVPVLIIRPSVVESSYNEPVPGWIQGNRMFDPVIISYGKGQLPAYLADPNAHMDIVPVDMVANTTIAAIAKHGIRNKAQLDVYHVATGFVNPLRFSDFFEYIYQHFNANPLSCNPGSIAKMKLFDEFSDFSTYVRQEISDRNGMRHEIGLNGNNTLQKMHKQYKAKVAYAENLCKMYEFIGFIKARFHTGNTQKLLEEMSKEERAEFEIDATKIDWRKYFEEIHIQGLRKHVLDGSARLSV